MSLNVSHTPDGRGGVLIYNGEVILLYIKQVKLEFSKTNNEAMKGKHEGSLYLTSHRIIFTAKVGKSDRVQSFCMPFHCVRDVQLEQPVLGANYIKGGVVAQPNGNWEGDASFSLTFHRGGACDFATALLKAVSLASSYAHYTSPPPYMPPAGGYFSPPPAYYMPQAGSNSYGFQAPTQTFPDAPSEHDVFMYEEPPPYSGIGQAPPPYPAGKQTKAEPAPPPPYPHQG